MELAPLKEALLRKRGEILSAGAGVKPLQGSMDTNSRQGDLVCRDCGEPIAPARLNAIPWTRVCITCKEKQSS
jgi:hypothetical protein